MNGTELDATDAASLLFQLKDAVCNLSAPPSVQEAYLRRIGTWPLLDELALEFDDSLKPLEHTAFLTAQQRNALRELDVALAENSGQAHADFWDGTIGALGDPEWQRIRALASVALATFAVAQ